MKRWTQKQAMEWYAKLPWLVGCNYLPRGASNQLEMWQADTFDPRQIKEELGWAKKIGMNTARIFLHDLLWKHDAKGLIKRIDKVLGIAHRLKIRVMIVFFDSVWHPHPAIGPQSSPKPYVHNSGWAQSPGVAVLRDRAAFDSLEEYVGGVISHFAEDERVLVWDLWNEPDNSNPASYGEHDLGAEKPKLASTLLPHVFEWARKAKPVQPLTSGIWAGDWESEETMKEHEKVQVELSDVVSFHCYGPPEDLERRVTQLQRYHRPLLCTEYMSRGSGSTFEGSLPILKRHNVAAYNWGFVAGRSQTIFPWDSWQKAYTGEPELWFHDIFREDGSAYRPEEIALIAELCKPAPAKRRSKKVLPDSLISRSDQ